MATTRLDCSARMWDPRRGGMTALLVVLSMAASCGGRLGYRSEIEVDQSFEVGDGVTRLRLESMNGSVTVVGGDGAGIEITGRLMLASDSEDQHTLMGTMPPRFEVAESGEAHLMLLRGPGWPAGVDPLLNVFAMEVVVRVPRTLGTAVHVDGRGHLAAKDLEADFELHNRHGNLLFENCRGRGVARSERSKVTVDRHAGSLDIELASGEIWVTGSEVGAPGFRLETGAGNIHCIVRRGTEIQLDAATGMGRATNGFDIPVEELDGGAKRMVGGEGVEVYLRTGEGSVSIGMPRGA